MASKKKLLQAAAGVGGAGLDVDEVFSTYVYTGNSSTQTITNGIDLSGEGGLLWIKQRTAGTNEHHWLLDSERTAQHTLSTNLTSAQISQPSSPTFNSDGFDLYNWFYVNDNNEDYVSWTFRKAPKFFDVQTWTGNGTAGRTISHDLGSDPGMVIIKRTDSTQNWVVHHRSLTSTKYLALNLTNGEINGSDVTATSSTNITLSDSFNTNGNSATYVGYFFAHNNSDGEFGPDADQDIIKCGSYTGNGSSLPNTISLGFEPQWVMVKKINGTSDWAIWDVIRGMTLTDNAEALEPNTTTAEASTDNIIVYPTADGFEFNDASDFANANGNTYAYMAIRRGSLAEPENATDVFAVDDVSNGASEPDSISGFPVDFVLRRYINTTNNWVVCDRLRNHYHLKTNSTDAEAALNSSTTTFDYMNGVNNLFSSNNTNFYHWMWKRAPGYFDVVAFELGTNANREVKHNLSATPEMIWWKKRNAVSNWAVFHKDLGQSKYLTLQDTSAEATSSDIWGTSSFSSTAFYLKESSFGSSGDDCIAYLFATVAGVSKVGSYTGTGAQQNIDCGFSSGARFVLIKRSSGTGHWRLMDSERGIVSGVDKTLLLNTTNAETTDEDTIDPHSSGFSVPNNADVNASGSTYIFYAIA